ncbi:nuclear transport factor 2 family protein [Streptomyces sp. P38-E01]|uniref:Nuclear transport factor 2 family protein n=1 Tax=Streptomyces tardus TaxID=2780544 RepID=A0A949JI20_9ACTN|nr:nuclear transport factor 2 family protein [Streptomyces tardus]MBU7600518.1 nuclear transport factor 2 family protein [Streptomyces tardus]
MTFRTDIPTESVTGHAPTEEELCTLREWFTHYDACAARGETAKLAELAHFPLNLVTDDSSGTPWCGQWSREQYLSVMGEVMGGGDDVAFEATRTPFFLGGSLAVVFTRSTMTAAGVSYQLDYADILVRTPEGWRFQTMVQSGWGEMMAQGAA